MNCKTSDSCRRGKRTTAVNGADLFALAFSTVMSAVGSKTNRNSKAVNRLGVDVETSVMKDMNTGP